jgi:hypothetical protein
MTKNRSFRPLLAITLLVLFSQPLQASDPEIRWAPVSGAGGYLVEIRQAAKMVVSETVKEPLLVLYLAPGNYQVRITTLNKLLRPENSTDWNSFSVLRAVIPTVQGISPDVLQSGQPQRFLIRGTGFSSSTEVKFLSSGDTEIPITGNQVLSPQEIEFSVVLPLEPGTYTIILRNPPNQQAELRGGLVVTASPETPEATQTPSEPVPRLVPKVGEQSSKPVSPEPELPSVPEVTQTLPVPVPAPAEVAEQPLKPAPPKPELPSVPQVAQTLPPPQKPEPAPAIPVEVPSAPSRISFSMGIGYGVSLPLSPWNYILGPSYQNFQAFALAPLLNSLGPVIQIEYSAFESKDGTDFVRSQLNVWAISAGGFLDLDLPVPVRLRLAPGFLLTEASIGGTNTSSFDFFASGGASIVWKPVDSFFLELGVDFRVFFYVGTPLQSLELSLRTGITF